MDYFFFVGSLPAGFIFSTYMIFLAGFLSFVFDSFFCFFSLGIFDLSGGKWDGCLFCIVLF